MRRSEIKSLLQLAMNLRRDHDYAGVDAQTLKEHYGHHDGHDHKDQNDDHLRPSGGRPSRPPEQTHYCRDAGATTGLPRHFETKKRDPSSGRPVPDRILYAVRCS